MALRTLSEAGFDVFVSYSHTSDQALAEALRGGLHRFARPWYRMRAMRVFQDVASMSANPALWPAIEDALSRSRHLVVLASPEAAASPWVGREIEYWKANKPAGTLLLAVTSGGCVWDDEAGDFDWGRSDAVPRALEGEFEDEPFWLDLRGLTSPEQYSMRHAGFNAKVAQLAARVRGLSLDAVFGTEVRQHRRRRRAIGATIVVLALLAATALVAAVLATRNANTAEARLREVSSRQLAAQALELKDGAMDTALLLAARAWRTSPTPAARNGLLSVVQEAEQGLEGYPRLPAGVAAPFVLDTLAVSADGSRAVAGRCDCGDFSAGGTGETQDGRLFVWRLDRPGDSAQVLDPRDAEDDRRGLKALLPGPDGRFVLSLDTGGRIRLWDTGTGAVRLMAPGDDSAWITSVDDGRYFAAALAPGRTVFLDARTGGRIAEVRGDLLPVVGDVGRRAVAAGADARGRLVFWDAGTGRALGTGPSLGTAPGDIPALSLGAGGWRAAVVVGAGRTAVTVVDTTDASVVTTVRPRSGGTVVQAALRPDGKELALVDDRGRLTTRAVPGGAARLDLRVPAADGAEVTRLVYSPSGRLLSVSSGDGSVARTFKHVVNASTGATRALLQTSNAQFAADEKLVLGWRDTGVEVGDLAAGLSARKERATVSASAVSADARYVATAEYDRVRLWDLTGDEARPILLPGVPGSVHGLSFTADGSRLVAVGAYGRAVLWDVGRALRHHLDVTLPFDPRTERRYDVTRDGRGFVTVSEDGTAQIRDLTTGGVRRTVRLSSASPADSVRLSPDGGHLLLFTTDLSGPGGTHRSTASLVRMSDGRKLRDYRASLLPDVGFSADGHRVVWLPDPRRDGTRVAVVHDTARADGSALATLRLTGFAADDDLGYALDATGERLAVTGTSGRVVVLDVGTGDRVMVCDPLADPFSRSAQAVSFGPRGTTVAVSSQDGTVRLLEPDGSGGCRVRGSAPGSGPDAEFSPDGSLLLTEGDMRLRDVGTMELVGEPLFDDAGPLPADVFFTPDGRLLEVSYDGTVRGLDLDPTDLTRRACALAGRDLTREEWERFGVLGGYETPCADG